MQLCGLLQARVLMELLEATLIPWHMPLHYRTDSSLSRWEILGVNLNGLEHGQTPTLLLTNPNLSLSWALYQRMKAYSSLPPRISSPISHNLATTMTQELSFNHIGWHLVTQTQLELLERPLTAVQLASRPSSILLHQLLRPFMWSPLSITKDSMWRLLARMLLTPPLGIIIQLLRGKPVFGERATLTMLHIILQLVQLFRSQWNWMWQDQTSPKILRSASGDL